MTALLRSAQLGAAAGLRTVSAPSQLSWRLGDDGLSAEEGPVAEFLARAPVRSLLLLGAIAEMIGDKLPTAPDRIDPGPLVGRALSGALAGGVWARINGERAAAGIFVGGAAAVASAFAGYHLRRILVHEVGLRDLPVALCEDAVALGLARGALRS